VARLAPIDGVPESLSEDELDWNGARSSWFFSSSASSYGPMLADRVDAFLDAGGLAVAHTGTDRRANERRYRLITFGSTSGMAVVIDGRRPSGGGDGGDGGDGD
jgi:hypothetical protein